jgi:hypothetical protein
VTETTRHKDTPMMASEAQSKSIVRGHQINAAYLAEQTARQASWYLTGSSVSISGSRFEESTH